MIVDALAPARELDPVELVSRGAQPPGRDTPRLMVSVEPL